MLVPHYVRRTPRLTTRSLSIAGIVTAIAVAIMIDTQILAATAATVWALVGLLHMGPTSATILAATLGVPALVLCWIAFKWAIEAETTV